MRNNQRQATLFALAIVLGLAPSVEVFAGGGGGGGLAGNGGSLSEQNIGLAYLQLPKAINSCLSSESCQITTEDATVLKQIRDIALENANRRKNFEYISAKKKPGFFDTAENAPHRISKTEFVPGALIYFNTDLTSGPDGNRSMAVADAAGILVHELGHQAKVTDHQYLDRLGAKFRMRLGADWARHEMLVDSSGESRGSIEIFNFIGVGQHPDVLLTSEGKTTNVTAQFASQVRCPESGMLRLGYSVTNGHWLWPAADDRGAIVRFHGWVNVHCTRSQAASVTTSYLDLNVVVRPAAESELEKVIAYVSENMTGPR